MTQILGPVPIVDREVTCPCGCNTRFQVKQVKGAGASYMDDRTDANFSHVEILKFLVTLTLGTEWTNRQLYSWLETWYGNQRKLLPFEFPRIQGAVSELQRKNVVKPTKYKFYKLTSDLDYVNQIITTGRF